MSQESPKELLEAAEEAMMMGQYTMAERLFRQVLEQEPTNARALHNLAVLYEVTHRPKEARELYLRLRELEPENQEYQRKLEELGGL